MFALEVVVGVAVLVGVALVVGRNMTTFDDEPLDTADPGLPVGRMLRSDDVPRLRFRVGLRGYRMSDVDEAMDAVYAALHAAETSALRPAAVSHGRGGPSDADLAEQPSDDVESQAVSALEKRFGSRGDAGDAGDAGYRGGPGHPGGPE